MTNIEQALTLISQARSTLGSTLDVRTSEGAPTIRELLNQATVTLLLVQAPQVGVSEAIEELSDTILISQVVSAIQRATAIALQLGQVSLPLVQVSAALSLINAEPDPEPAEPEPEPEPEARGPLLSELIRTHGVRRDRRGFPTAYVWVDNEPNANGRMYALVEGIEGLAPQRERSLDEFGRGIESLDPPMVVATDWNDLVDLALEATDEAIRSTLGADLLIGEALMVRYKTACMVRGCLRDAGVDA
jgi:hypothetical protein